MPDDVHYLIHDQEGPLLLEMEARVLPDMPVETARAILEAGGMIPAGKVLTKSSIGLGRFHPRMARRLVSGWSHKLEDMHGPLGLWMEKGIPPHPRDAGALADSMNQVAILVRSLTDIFEKVSPAPANLQSYGTAVGNALLLACIDFENECKGVLRANNYAFPGRPGTPDYVKLNGPMRLAEHAVTFPFYPMIEERRPFRTWDRAQPSASIPWYDAYNKYKHDRYENADKAMLDMLIDAVAAMAIMMAAQYRVIPSWKQRVGEFFAIAAPRWDLGHSYINPGLDQSLWVENKFAF